MLFLNHACSKLVHACSEFIHACLKLVYVCSEFIYACSELIQICLKFVHACLKFVCACLKFIYAWYEIFHVVDKLNRSCFRPLIVNCRRILIFRILRRLTFWLALHIFNRRRSFSGGRFSLRSFRSSNFNFFRFL